MKNLAWFAAFAALLFIGDRAGGFALQKLTDGSQFRWSRLYRGDAAADILLLGNSRGMTFIEPEIEKATGKRAFNLSYNGLPMDMAAVLATDFLEKYPPPSHLVIDITMADRRNKSLMSGLWPFAEHSPGIRKLLRDSVGDSFWGGQLSHLFRFNNEVFQRAFFHRNRSDAGQILDREIRPELVAELSKNSYKLDIYPDLIEKLAEICRLAKSKGVDVRLVISPYFPGFEVKNLDLLLKTVEAKTGLAVADYRNALTDHRLFGDFMHPNRAGAEAYIGLLRQDKVLP